MHDKGGGFGSKRAFNLARIHHNQRRSQVTRKEYLSEIEATFRNCEQIGAEANVQLQTLARKVLEENEPLPHYARAGPFRHSDDG
ncbi:hypothetical protein LTS12_026482, partial [Elasticomyces elasticus]